MLVDSIAACKARASESLAVADGVNRTFSPKRRAPRLLLLSIGSGCAVGGLVEVRAGGLLAGTGLESCGS